VGNEFSSVEALWSQFENFMGRPEEEKGDSGARGKEGHREEGHSEEHDKNLAEEKIELDG
jgi:DASH complex subunit DAD1